MLFGIKDKHLAFLIPRSFVEINRDAIAHPYIVLLKEGEDDAKANKEVEKENQQKRREEFNFGVFCNEEKVNKNDMENTKCSRQCAWLIVMRPSWVPVDLRRQRGTLLLGPMYYC